MAETLARRSFLRSPSLATAAVCILLWVLRRLRFRPRNVHILPGQIVLGSMFQVIQAIRDKKFHEMMCRCHALYGRTFALKAIFAPWVVATTSPENIEHVLNTEFDNYCKGAGIRAILADLLGMGVVNSDGHEWLKQREVMNRIFTSAPFKEHILTVVRRNAKKLRHIVGSVEPGQPVDISNLMHRFTLDTVGEIGFGMCIDSLANPSSQFQKSFDRGQQILVERFFSPFWWVLKLLRIGPERETHAHMRRLDTFARKIVKGLRVGMVTGTMKCSNATGVAWDGVEASKSFVGLLLRDAQKREEELNDAYLRDSLLNFLTAGRDTTAKVLSWTIFCLSQHPGIAIKVREEILCQKLPKVCEDTEEATEDIKAPSYVEIDNLPYLHAVISEALRLYPPIPCEPRQAIKDDVWPDGTCIPRGTTVMCNFYSMGRDEGLWGDDAEVFRPERWLERKEPPTSYEHPVFNAGPRECLGQRLAWVEMKTCLAMLLPHFSFKLASEADQVVQPTLSLTEGLQCFVTSEAAANQKSQSNTSTGACSDSANESGVSSQSESGSEVDGDSSMASDGGLDSSSAASTGSNRVRGKKRKSGWTRQRRSRFWNSVRQLSPDREFD